MNKDLSKEVKGEFMDSFVKVLNENIGNGIMEMSLGKLGKFKVERVQETVTICEKDFFKNSDTLWVDSSIEKYIGYSDLIKKVSIPSSSVFSAGVSEGEMFGLVGTEAYKKSLLSAISLAQVALLIKMQSEGQEGELLVDGASNPIQTINRIGKLCLIIVVRNKTQKKWTVSYSRFIPNHVWQTDKKIFKNIFTHKE